MSLGLGPASALLQVHLGLGLLLAAASTFVALSPALKKQLAGAPWEAALRAAARAAGPIPALAAFALVQARGAAPDILSWAGLGASCLAIVLGIFFSILGPVVGAGIAETVGDAGGQPAAVAASRFSTALRVLSSLRACGQAALVFAELPGGMQLRCASLLLRLALANDAIIAATGAPALAPDAVSAAAVDAADVLGFAPLLGGLALLDHIAWGPCSLLLVPLQPALSCMVVALLILVVSLGLGCADDSGRPELDFRVAFGNSADKGGNATEVLRFSSVALLYATKAFGVARILAGTFHIESSLGRFSIQWGEPLAATAVLLAALTSGIYIAGYAVSLSKPDQEQGLKIAATNGAHSPEADAVAESCVGSRSLMSRLNALIAPAPALLLALVAVHMTFAGDLKQSSLDKMVSLAGLPFKYGFILAAAGVWFQVLLLLAFALLHCDSTPLPEPPLDGVGTLCLEPRGDAAGRSAEYARYLTLGLLEGGLLLGCVGLGPFVWVAGGLIATVSLYVAAPPEARQRAHGVAMVCLTGLMFCAGKVVSGADAYLEQRRQAQEAVAARHAAALAEALQAEERGEAGKAAASSKQPASEKKAQAAAEGTVGAPKGDKKDLARRKRK